LNSAILKLSGRTIGCTGLEQVEFPEVEISRGKPRVQDEISINRPDPGSSRLFDGERFMA